MLCRGALCLQFTCCTTFPRARLGSSPEWEEDCGDIPSCLDVCSFWGGLPFSLCVYLGRVTGLWDKSSQTASSTPSSARLQSCSALQVMLLQEAEGAAADSPGEQLGHSGQVKFTDLGTAPALPNNRLTAHQMESRQGRKGWLQKGSLRAQKPHHNKQCV